MRVNYIFSGLLLLFSAYMHYINYFDHWGVIVPQEGCYVLALGGIYFMLCGFNMIMKNAAGSDETVNSVISIEPNAKPEVQTGNDKTKQFGTNK